MKQWDKIFKKRGKVFLKPQEDIPKISKIFKKNKIERILDLGCGTGRHIIYFTKKKFNVYGIDVARKGIEITKTWLKKEKIRAKLKIGSIYEKLPYKDNFFDAVISTQVIHHAKIGDIRNVIKEIERILKLGGLVFVTVSKKGSKKGIPKDKIWKIRFIAPRTFIPLSHDEKGLIHYWFNKKLLRKEFRNFKIYDIWVESNGRHYCLLAKLRR